MLKFEVFENMKNIVDSMELDSGTTICALNKDGNEVIIEVRGRVDVYWYPNGEAYDYERYRYPSDFPQELKNIIHNGNLFNDSRVSVENNNWFEVFYNYDEDYDVVDISGHTEVELLSLCLECMDLFNDTHRKEIE